MEDLRIENLNFFIFHPIIFSQFFSQKTPPIEGWISWIFGISPSFKYKNQLALDSARKAPPADGLWYAVFSG